MTEAPILAHHNSKKQIYLKANSSNYVNAEVLSQTGDDGLLHSVAFFSKNLFSVECNYEIYNRNC